MTEIPYKWIYDHTTWTDEDNWWTRRMKYPKVTLKKVGVLSDNSSVYECPVCGEHTVQGFWNMEQDIDYRCSNEECDFADDEMFVIIQGEEE
jgi:predicted RNA-binding Zn-ribbon protein involved in translation (DUF1610 family)